MSFYLLCVFSLLPTWRCWTLRVWESFFCGLRPSRPHPAKLKPSESFEEKLQFPFPLWQRQTNPWLKLLKRKILKLLSFPTTPLQGASKSSQAAGAECLPSQCFPKVDWGCSSCAVPLQCGEIVVTHDKMWPYRMSGAARIMFHHLLLCPAGCSSRVGSLLSLHTQWFSYCPTWPFFKFWNILLHTAGFMRIKSSSTDHWKHESSAHPCDFKPAHTDIFYL